MCGLCGVVAADHGRSIDERTLGAMRDVLAHRGPDDAGLHVAPGVALGSRRLAVVDLSPRGHMPMRTADGRYHIVYNGEVYNGAELRTWLRGRGRAFRSRTDTEVVLELYAHEGPAMLERLNGMFALAIWDARDRTLFLARDRLGVKPLYYAEHDGRLLFASEQKALFAVGLAPQFDPDTWDELLCFRYVAGEGTPFAGVRRLLPGHHLTWRDGALAVRRWWALHARARQPDAPPDAWFRATFDDAVALRRISDVPLGVLLSGGLDSGSVAASLGAHGGEGLASFTVTFEGAGVNEGPVARQVAERWRLDPHELSVRPDELLPRLLRASWLNDEPLVHGNELHILAIAEHARSLVTVLLSGEGADETLGGYVRYRPLLHPRVLALARAADPLVQRLLPAGGRLAKLGRMLALGSARRMALFNACEVLPGDLAVLGGPAAVGFPYREAVLDEAERRYPGEPVRQAMYADQHTFLCSLLDRNDRMTMGASIECRVPFLDYRLVEGLAALPTSVLFAGRRSKPLLRRALGDRLPAAVLRQPKWGFGVPWTHYFRTVPELRALVADLPRTPPVDTGPFGRGAVADVVRRFLAGDERVAPIVRQLVMIALWYQACVVPVPQLHARRPTVR